MTIIELDSSVLRSTVAFTGRLACMSRAKAFDMVRQHGGTPSQAVTRQTNVLVVGELGWSLLEGARASPNWHCSLSQKLTTDSLAHLRRPTNPGWVTMPSTTEPALILLGQRTKAGTLAATAPSPQGPGERVRPASHHLMTHDRAALSACHQHCACISQ
jgi:hypothetical protein